MAAKGLGGKWRPMFYLIAKLIKSSGRAGASWHQVALGRVCSTGAC